VVSSRVRPTDTFMAVRLNNRAYGDFQDVHRCAVLSAESRAGQYGHDDVKSAVAHLHGMLDGARSATRG
jgi:hypothetical protein